jgi:hypothetical protein
MPFIFVSFRIFAFPNGFRNPFSKRINLKRSSTSLLRTVFIWLSLMAVYSVSGQRSAAGFPPSSLYRLPPDERFTNYISQPDLRDIRQEDQEFPTPYRYGINLPVNFTPDNSGYWTNLPNGGRIWRVTVNAAGALALSACFNRFEIPEGGKLFLYNKDKSKVIGAFTSSNIAPGGYFATELLAGDQLTLEYLQPANSAGTLNLQMYKLVYAYRGVAFLTGSTDGNPDAGSCEVNVNCPEGQEWQLQGKGVVRISITRGPSTFWCSGSVLNNVRQDHTPYVLTADHCGLNTSAEDLLQWVFYFNFEAAGCPNPGTPPEPQSLTGAIKVAESGSGALAGSDFFLVVIDEPIPSDYDVFYNGWNRMNAGSPSGVGIHHPGGDIKKISTYTHALVSSNYGSNLSPAFWKVFWVQTVSGHGVTEPGSSGSPIFDSAGRVVGTLTGGESACDSLSLNMSDFYGKFYWSWDQNGSDSTRRLRDWLDPDSTGVTSLDGLFVSVPEKRSAGTFSLFPNPFRESTNLVIPGVLRSSVRVEVFNLTGILVGRQEIDQHASSAIPLKFPGLIPGIYVMKIYTDEGISCLKMIKE